MARVLYLYAQALRADSDHARRTFQMLALLRESGFLPDVLTLPGGDPWPEGLAEHIYVTARVPFTRTLRPYGFGFRRAWATVVMALTAIRLSLQHPYEVAHCSDRAIRIGGLIAWLFGVKFVFEWRSASGYDLVKWAQWRNRHFRAAVNLALTDRPYAVSQLRTSELYGKIAYIPSLPLPTLKPLPPPPIRTQTAVQIFRLAAFSYTSDLRDLSLFCDALPQILSAQNVQITLIGGTPIALERLRQTLHLRFPKEVARILFRPQPIDAEDLTATLTNTDLVFLPAHAGAIAPFLLLDLMALGRALLAIRCPAYESLLNHQNATLISATALAIAESVRLHLLSPTRCTIHASKVAETIQQERNPIDVRNALKSCYSLVLSESQP